LRIADWLRLASKAATLDELCYTHSEIRIPQSAM